MQSKSAPKNKEKKEKKVLKKSNSAGKVVAAVGNFLLSGRRPSKDKDKGSTNGTRETAEGAADETLQPLASSGLPRPVSNGSLASGATSEFSETQEKVAAVVHRLSSQCGQGLSATAPVEDFLAQGLLPVPEGLLQVSPLEPIGSVVEKIYQWRLRSCIVAFPDGKKEFFDCMDLACSILEAVIDSEGNAEEKDWESTKRSLRAVAEGPVSNALSRKRGADEFRPFDAEGSLLDLLRMFSSLNRVPVYRRGELCRVVTPSDILEICCCVSEDTVDCLEGTLLTEMMRVCPGILSEIQVPDDWSVIEVLRTMRDRDVNVTPVVEGLRRSSAYGSEGSVTRINSMSSMSSLDGRLDSAEPCGSIARNLVGQFDTAALRVMLVHLDPDEGSWWWEDGSLNRNILLEPCMDYLSLCSTVIVSHSIERPFHILKAEETLAHSITKVLTSHYQSVVVYPSIGPGGDNQASARGEPKIFHGTVTTLALVVAMVQGGLFEVLRFDPSKPRREVPQDGPGGKNRRATKTSTLTKLKITIPEDPSQDESPAGRSTKVKFCSTVELDCLDVPTCPEHGVRHLKFQQEGMFPLDFRTLRDISDASKAAGAAAQCTGCSRPLGRVRMREISSPTSPMTQSGLFDLGDSGSWYWEMPFFKKSPENAPMRYNSGSPVASALKRGTNFPLKKSKTAERLDAIRANQTAKVQQPSNESSQSRSFFGVCCSPCRMQNDKDQIPTSSMSALGGDTCSRESTGVSQTPIAGSFDGVSSPVPRYISTISGRASPPDGSVPRLAVPGMAPNTRVVREGTDRARVIEINDARRSVSDPTFGSSK